MSQRSVIIIDDNSGFRAALARFLEGAEDLSLVASAQSASEGLAAVSKLRPDVVLVDVAMPDVSGLEALPRLRQLLPRAALIVLTSLSIDFYREAALDAGADDIVAKIELTDRLLGSIRRALRARASSAGDEPRVDVDVEPGGVAEQSADRRDDFAVTLDLDADLERVVTAMRSLCRADDAVVALREPGADYATIRHWLGDGDPPADVRIVPGAGRAGAVLASGQRQRGPVQGDPSRSEMVVAVADEGAVEGVLSVTRRGTEPFTEADEAILVNLAEHAAIAIRHARVSAQERRARATLIATEEATRLRDRAFETTSQGIVVLDAVQPDHPILYVNTAFQQITRYTRNELIGRSGWLFRGPGTDAATVATMREAMAQGRPCTVEVLVYRKDGSEVWCSVAISQIHDDEGRVTHHVGVVIDITERRELEEQFRHAQKMDAMGRLAAGVAHDFNNLLTVISGRSELTLRRLAPNDPVRRDIELIHATAMRAAGLTRQLLAFSRKRPLRPEVVDLNAVVRSMDDMLRRVLGEQIEVRLSLAPDACMVRADQVQLEQVILNLAVNARDAMPAGGVLRLSTTIVELDGMFLHDHPDARTGAHVLLEVTDSGIGMDRETRARIFEPFFTTKESGKGTGLGLSTVYGIVKQHGGAILVESQPRHGTTFRIYLPRAESTSSPGAPLPPPAAEPARPAATVLLVEDDEDVRSLTADVLRRAGYTVVEAAHGDEALRLAQGHRGPLDVLMTDLVMPHMSGRALAVHLSRLHPGLAVIYMSGYSTDALDPIDAPVTDAVVLEKPFTTEALVRTVTAALVGPRRVSGPAGSGGASSGGDGPDR